MKRYSYLIAVLVFIFSAYEVASAIYISRSTGLLIVKTDSLAAISIDQTGHKIINLRRGSSIRVRLSPGNYDIIASKNKEQTIKTISVQKHQTTYQDVRPQPQSLNPKAAYNGEANKLISTYLPYAARAFDYRVGYIYQIVGSASQPIIVITSPARAGQQAALKWIQGLGFNPSHFDIKYILSPLE